MHGRLSTTRVLCLLAVALVLGICRGNAAENAGLAPLQSSYQLNVSGRNQNFDLALDEIIVIDAADRSATSTATSSNDPQSLLQLSTSLEAGGNAEVRLIIYPSGSQRNRFEQLHIGRRLLVELEPAADPNALAVSLSIVYRGALSYMPGVHLFETGSAATTLRVLASLRAQPGVRGANPDVGMVNEFKFVPNDPLFTNQWHLLNTGQQGAQPGADVNITNAWERFTGSNVVIGVFDSGFELTHPDLQPNFITNAAYNVNDGSQDVLPTLGDTEDFHGTAVSGVAAARGNNAEGGTGSAPLASIIPIKVDFATVLSSQLAEGLIHSNELIHVHNNSWGPGGTFARLASYQGPILSAITNGVTFGRRGRGTIYMFAAGNDGDLNADINYSELGNSMFTLAVGALNDLGARANYSTPGAAVVISAPSGLETIPNGRFQGTTTTDQLGTNGYNNTFSFPLGDYTNRDYTANFNGTSSATPLASGVVALMLEANTNLTWRDVQEIVMRTARKNDTNHSDWITNAAGFHFNHDYGAGIINADGATQLATNWTNLGLRTNLVFTMTNLSDVIPDFDSNGVSRAFVVTNHDLRLEHVRLHVRATHLSRGDLEIELTSPSGTPSILARSHFDINPDYDWTFTTVRNWGEFASGGSGNGSNQWTVTIRDLRPGSSGFVDSLELSLFGTITNSNVLGINDPPVITEHPASRTVTKGSTLSFRVKADSVTPLSYRWLFTGANGSTTIINSNRNELRLDAVTSANQGIYTVEVFNQNGVTRSAPATLFVNSPPEITAGGQPASRSSAFGGSATFNVAATGAGPLLYQWRRNAQPITNATSSSLTLTNLQATDFTSYDVIVRNTLASVISQPALLSVVQGVVFTNVVPMLTNGTFQFSFTGATNQSVRIESTADLTNWITLGTNVLTGGSSTFSDQSAGTNSSRFYRVVPLP